MSILQKKGSNEQQDPTVQYPIFPSLCSLNGPSYLPFALRILRHTLPALSRLTIVPTDSPMGVTEVVDAHQKGDWDFNLSISVASHSRLSPLHFLADPKLDEGETFNGIVLRTLSSLLFLLTGELDEQLGFTFAEPAASPNDYEDGDTPTERGKICWNIGGFDRAHILTSLVQDIGEYRLLPDIFPDEFFNLFDYDQRLLLYRQIVARSNELLPGSTFCNSVSRILGEEVLLEMKAFDTFSAELNNPEIRLGESFILNDKGMIYNPLILAKFQNSRLEDETRNTIKRQFYWIKRLLLPSLISIELIE